MASQIGDNRVYTSAESEKDAAAVRRQCGLCQVITVPRGITSTRTSAVEPKHCPNCGNVFGRGVFPEIPVPVKVTGITVTGAGNATTITVDKAKLQMSAAVLPANATLKTVTWSVTNGTGTATIDVNGQVSSLTNGTVTIKATAKDGSGVVGQVVLTLSNQV